MGATAEGREPFVAALVGALQEAGVAGDPDGGEEAFYAAKQRLLDRYAAGSDESLAVASITWEEIRPMIGAG